jgi:hypothetical protein
MPQLCQRGADTLIEPLKRLTHAMAEMPRFSERTFDEAQAGMAHGKG